MRKKGVNLSVFNILLMILLIVAIFALISAFTGCKIDVSKNVNSENVNTDVSEKVKLDAAYLPLRDSKENINTILAKESLPQTGTQTDTSSQTLDELVNAFDTYAKADKEYYHIREKSENFLLINQTTPSKKGVLLIHGLGASPNEMRELGNFLYENGFTVLGVRLDGHGDGFEYLESSSWQNWYRDVEYSYNILEHLSDDVYVVGISTGATLGLMLAEKEEFKGLVTIAPAIIMKDWKLNFISAVKYFVKSQKRTLSEEEKETYSEFLPTKTLEQLMKLINIVKTDKTSLNKVDEPILIIQATNDPRVKKESAEYVYNNVGTGKEITKDNSGKENTNKDKTEKKSKQLTWIKSDKHVILTGDTKDEVFWDVLVFLEED
ncbi:alpha/beta fold hydrolase [Candidatus Woesearchaeota archaeon]|nr:alpha/beta fold hydrolase [Candidatus Woesearchaeota archaeon]